MVDQPQQPEFLRQGFQKKKSYQFKENLKIIANCFDAAGIDLIKELDSVISSEAEQRTRDRTKVAKKSNKEALWTTFSTNTAYHVLSFDEKFKQYLSDKKSDYRMKLDEFKQAKNLLLEILRYIQHETFFEFAFLKLDALIQDLEKDDYQIPDINEAEIENVLQIKIRLKKEYIQKKMLHVMLIMTFKNKLFLFLENYFVKMEFARSYSPIPQYDPFLFYPKNLDAQEKNPLILDQLYDEEKKKWKSNFDIHNHVSMFNQLFLIKNSTCNIVNNIFNFIQDPKKAFRTNYLENGLTNSAIDYFQKIINLGNSKLSNFSSIDMEELEIKLRRVPDFIKVANQPAVWQVSTFLIKILPRFFINRFLSQAQIDNKIEQESNKALEKIKKGKKNLKSISKALQHVAKATGNIHPAIRVLERIQAEIFNNAVPQAIAEYIIQTRDFLGNCLTIFQNQVDNIKAIQQTLEVDKQNKDMAKQITSLADWANIFKTINQENEDKKRKNFYKHTLPLLPFLMLTKKNIPMFDTEEEFDNSVAINHSDQLIQNHLKKVYQYVDELDTHYLKKIAPYESLQEKINLHPLNDLNYGKRLLFLACLKDIKTAFKADYKDHSDKNNDSIKLEKENFKKIFCHSFPGTQNLKYLIKSDREKLRKIIFAKMKFEKEYEIAQDFLRQFANNTEYYTIHITESTGNFAKKIFTKVVLFLIKLLSFFIDKEKLFTYCDREESWMDHIIFQKAYDDFLSKHYTVKKAVKKAIKEYEKFDQTILSLQQAIDSKEAMYKSLKDFRKIFKNEIDDIWSLR